MATEFCQKCKQSHPGRVCDYDEKGDCSETLSIVEGSERDDSITDSRPEPGTPKSANKTTP